MSSYYGNVIPRYLDPRKPPPPLSLPPKEKIPVNPQYEQVAPRYMSPRRSAQVVSSSSAGAANPSSSTAKAKGHKAIAKDSLFQAPKNPKLSHIQPKFLDPSNYAPQANSPRRIVEQKHILDRRELGWRTDLINGSMKSFDDYRPQTAAREATQPQRKNAFKNAPSSIAAYVKDNIPIRHASMAHLINATSSDGKKHDEQHHNSSSRQPSPFRSSSRTGSPTRWWSNAGWQGTEFAARERQTTLCQPQYLKEIKHVEEQVAKCSSARVSPNHVPRVAMLAPGFRLQEMLKADREASHARAESTIPAMSHQPSPSRPDSPARTPRGGTPVPVLDHGMSFTSRNGSTQYRAHSEELA
jgi:hypothetical protein